VQYNDQKNAEIALGYTQKLSNILEVGGTMRMYPTKQFTYRRSDGPTIERNLIRIGYTAYSVNTEYALMKDLALQGYFGWAKNSDTVLDDNKGGGNPVDVTEMGINAIKTIGAHTIIGGLARINAFEKTCAADTKGSVTDLTKLYASYAYAF